MKPVPFLASTLAKDSQRRMQHYHCHLESYFAIERINGANSTASNIVESPRSYFLVQEFVVALLTN